MKAPNALPHDAIGIESEEFAIEFRANKIVFMLKDGSGKHYTLQTDHPSGVVDLHETVFDSAKGEKTQRTLGAIHKEALAEAIAALAPNLPEFLNLFRPLRLAWLAHKGITVVRGLEPVTDQDIAAITKRTRRKRLAVDPERLQTNLRIPEFLDEVWEFPDGPFSLLRREKLIGIAWKITANDGSRLYWIKLRDFERMQRRNAHAFMKVLEALAIPRERYGDYWFLRP